MVESKGQKLVVIGDLTHVAAAQRKKFYAQAAKEHFLLAATHVSFPGIGRVRTEGAGYAWMPANYMISR